MQCDGYSAYRAFADRTDGIELSGCWTHVRRKFHDALEQTPGRAGWVMRQIQHLYRVESRLRETKAGPKLRQAVRSHQSRPILERLHKALLLFKSGRLHLPQSLLGQAVDYALGQWSTLFVLTLKQKDRLWLLYSKPITAKSSVYPGIHHTNTP